MSGRPSVESLRGPSMSTSSPFMGSATTNVSHNNNNNRSRSTSQALGAPTGPSASLSGDVPRNEDDLTQYVLYDGLPHSGPHVQRARERQSQAYLHFTHRIHERVEAAHALVLSANPLSLSVMASQLRMYRWRVSEAQTLLEATSLLQDFVMDTAKHGYRVRRRPAPPLGQSRYAYGRGKQALRRIAQEEREKLGGKTTATTTAAAATSSSSPSASTRTSQRAADAAARPSATTAAAPLPVNDELLRSADLDDAPEERTEEEDRLPLPAPDALPRLVLVDGFTHEDFADIARHVRFVDNEHGLDLLLVLLLPTDPEAAAMAAQGAGCVVTPAHTTTMSDAYAAGFDLVLAHGMDNLLVDFLTSAFVSSVGRWRNDVRSKAAVGNYMSVRNVLLGGLDTASLQQLVWDDNTDDAEVLELLGAQSLSVQGGAKRYGEASRQLLGQQQQQQQQKKNASPTTPGRAGSPLGPETEDDDDDGSGVSAGGAVSGSSSSADKALKRVASSMMSNVPRLRSRPSSVAHFGVRLPADQRGGQIPLTSFGRTKDVLGGVMTPAVPGSNNGGGGGAGGGKGARRRRHFDNADGNDDGLEEDEDDGAGDYFSDGDVDDPRMLRMALEKEMGRLLAENDGKQASIDTLQEEVASLHRMVAILKRHQPGGGGGGGADGSNSLSTQNLERPDSGSMVHLGKQQQIYILKERLEAANDQIVALLRDSKTAANTASKTAAGGRGRGGAGGGGGNRGGGNNNSAGVGGGSGGLISPTGAVVAVTAARRLAGGASAHSAASEKYRRRAAETYMAAREYEMMSLMDDDAAIAETAMLQLTQSTQDPTKASNPVAQRKEREATEQVINSLQDDLRFLQGKLDDVREGADVGTSRSDLQARMATHLQAAVERLETERQRVRHLEELRQTDQLLLAHAARMNEHLRGRYGGGGRRAPSESGDSSTVNDFDDADGTSDEGGDGVEEEDGSGSHRRGNGGARRRRRKNKANANAAAAGRTRSRKTGAATSSSTTAANAHAGALKKDKTGPASGAHPGSSSATTAAAGAGKSRTKRTEAEDTMLDAAQVEGLISAAVTDAVASRNRVFRRQLAALVQSCKTQLTRVVLKHQKPRTVAYMQMIEEELEQAKRDQRGAFMRLRFTLTNLRPDQYDAASIPRPSDVFSQDEDNGSSSNTNSNEGESSEDTSRMIPLRAVTDPDVRATAQRVAREHAAYALRVAYMTEELQRVKNAHATAAAGKAGGPKGEREKTPAATHGPDDTATATATADTRPPSSSPEQLIRAYQKATQHVRAAVEGVSPVQTYLDAVQAEMEAEQRLSPWVDVDCAQLFRTLPKPSANFVLTPASNLALVPTKHLPFAFPSASDFTMQVTDESTPLYLADVDGSVRDVAGVYGTLLQSFLSLADSAEDGDFSLENNRARGRGATTAAAAGLGGGGLRPAPPSRADGGEVVDVDSGPSPPSSSSARATPARPSPPPPPAVLSLHQALAHLPLASSEVAQYQGQLPQLYTTDGAYTAAQLRIYEVMLRAYQQHRINPLHMAAVEATVLATRDALPNSAALAKTQLRVAHAQHREVLSLLQLLCTSPQTSPMLRAMTQRLLRSQRLLEREGTNVSTSTTTKTGADVDGSSSSNSGSTGKHRPERTLHTSSAFLNAVDAALLGCLVDELRWRQLHRALIPTTTPTPPPPPGDERATSESADQPAGDDTQREAERALVAALVTARTTTLGGGPQAVRAATMTAPRFGTPDAMADDGGNATTAEEARLMTHYAAFCEAQSRAANARGAEDAMGGDDDDAADDLFDLGDVPPLPANSAAEAYRQLASFFPGVTAMAGGSGSGSGSVDDAGRTMAQQLAELFSKNRTGASAPSGNGAMAGAEAAEAETAFLRNMYLSDGSQDGSGFESDENTAAIRRLRMELEYMESLKKQRLEELAMRCGWGLQRRSDGAVREGSAGSGASAAGSGAGGFAYPAIDPDRLNFEVKSGTSAWYGMEAAKRVRDILRRRARPDQVIVGGGPDGGGVGIELSRRTAQPAATSALGNHKHNNTGTISGGAVSGLGGAAGKALRAGGTSSSAVAEENGYQVEDETAYDDRGGRHRQPHPHHHGCNSPSRQASTVGSLPPLRPNGLSRTQQQQQRFGSRLNMLTSLPGSEMGTPPMAYVSPRDAVSLSAYGNLVGSYENGAGGGAYGDDLSSRVLAYRAELTRAAGRLSPTSTATYANGAPYCLPLTSPAGAAPTGAAKTTTTTAAARVRSPLPHQTSWVYGVPAAAASSLVDQQSTVDPQQPRDTVLFMPPKPRSSIAEVAERGAARAAVASPYMTPAAIAAQRLQSMLNASMADPSVVGLSHSAVTAAMHRTRHPAQQHSVSSAPSTPRTASSPIAANTTGGGGDPRKYDGGMAGVSSSLPHSTNTSRVGSGNTPLGRHVSTVSDVENPHQLETTVGPEARAMLYDQED